MAPLGGTWTWTPGATRAGRRRGPPDEEPRERHVYLPPRAAEALRELKESARLAGPADWVWGLRPCMCERTAEGHDGNCAWRRHFRPALDAARTLARLPPGFRWHDLRARQATRLRAAGADFQTIQAVLGHSDRKTTEVYVQEQKEHIARARAALARLSTPGETGT